ncbi:hypothetical protein NPIL_402741 [Nephila pilipes]|uniref:Uncharacterized protein n=1 Tax=Nephila pilipes TaxID=299642 RepID=A0A8X6UCU6_NEPPI|nr:hypothetical protein NPIL_402741 [Nephila pilipes]
MEAVDLEKYPVCLSSLLVVRSEEFPSRCREVTNLLKRLMMTFTKILTVNPDTIKDFSTILLEHKAALEDLDKSTAAVTNIDDLEAEIENSLECNESIAF